MYAGFLLLGMFPPKVKNYKVLYLALLEHLEKSKLFSGFTVEDHAEEKIQERTINAGICRVVEDSRGLPNPTCCKSCPARVGTCPCCTIRGTKVFDRPCYIGAITYLYDRYNSSK